MQGLDHCTVKQSLTDWHFQMACENEKKCLWLQLRNFENSFQIAAAQIQTERFKPRMPSCYDIH
jgi:hypothetical protein